jgi:hypothetical protein
LGSIDDILNDDSLTWWEKFSSILTSALTAMMSITMAINTLSTAFDANTRKMIKNSAAKLFNILLGKSHKQSKR